MKEFLEKSKIFLAIIVGALIIGGAVWFLSKNSNRQNPPFTPPTSTLSTSSAQCLAPSKVLATKIIDGDTIIVEGGYNVRLLGIDADERGYSCYDEARKRLEELILNKEIRLEKDVTDVDQYKRCLRHVFLDKKNVGLELVEEGLVIARFYEPDVRYREEITLAEKTAIENKIGCKWATPKPSQPSAPGKFEILTSEKTGLEVVFACNAGNYYKKEAIVEGKIVAAYRSKTNTVFLNFEKPYPNHCFTGVIFSSDGYKFVQNPEEYYLNKTVRLRGEIKEYQGKPEIILKNPSQIGIGR